MTDRAFGPQSARDLAISVRSAMGADATPEQMERKLADMTTALAKTPEAWDTDQWIILDASEWSIDQERRDQLGSDFKTRRASSTPTVSSANVEPERRRGSAAG